MQISAVIRIVSLLGLSAPGLHAELVFERTRVEILAKPDQEQVEAVFKFENRGAAEARIVSVSSGCQCLSAKTSADVIPPEGSSEITGSFKVGNFPGVTEKTIQVRVSEGGSTRNLALTVAVELRELITIEPRTVTWIGGGATEEKTYTVTMKGDEPIRLLEVDCSRPGFDVRMETVKDGAEYRVHVTPKEGTGPALGVFRFTTDCKHPRFAIPIAFGVVKES